jgi:hypothetical protein
VHAAAGGKIPRLVDVLAMWPTDRWLNVELKAGGAAVARETVRVLAGRPGVVLSSFDPRMLLAARAAGSAYEHALLLAAESPAFLHANGAQAFGCAGVHLDHRLCTEGTIRRYQRRRACGRGVDGEQPLRKQEVASWGVDAHLHRLAREAGWARMGRARAVHRRAGL